MWAPRLRGETLGRTERSTWDDHNGRILATQECPAWWTWELELSANLLKRMEDRAFNEVDLITDRV